MPLTTDMLRRVLGPTWSLVIGVGGALTMIVHVVTAASYAQLSAIAVSSMIFFAGIAGLYREVHRPPADERPRELRADRINRWRAAVDEAMAGDWVVSRYGERVLFMVTSEYAEILSFLNEEESEELASFLNARKPPEPRKGSVWALFYRAITPLEREWGLV